MPTNFEYRRVPLALLRTRLPGVLGAALALSCADSGRLVATEIPDGGAETGAVDADLGPAICPAWPGAPPGVLPLPSASQVAYQRTELSGFMHFGLQTFDGTEYGAPSDSPSLFAPTNLDATQWVTSFKDAGFGQVTLVVKHSTGFCLWPSAYTDYSVKNSPWKQGQGDVVREFTDAMHAAGLRVGMAPSPWDEHYPSSSATYETYYRNQLTELLTNYGPVAELYIEGINAPKTFDWSGLAQLAKQLQPDIVIMMGPEIAAPGADVRYIGNQTGQSNRSLASVQSALDGGITSAWYPSEAPTSDRLPDWFWHSADTVISADSLQTVYFDSVGMNATLSLNVPPAQSGLIDVSDLGLLQQFGVWQKSTFETDLLRGQAATADSTWANAGFEVALAVDDDICTYWAAASGATSARLEVPLPSGSSFQIISIREPIELGERSTAYHVEIKQNGTWNAAPQDASGNVVKGSVIGQRQLWRFRAMTAEALALVIDASRDVPAIAEFSAY